MDHERFIEEMQAMGHMTDEDRQLLAEMQPAVERQAQAVVDAFYSHLDRFEHLNAIFHAEPGRIEKLKGHLKQWLIGLTAGEYGQAYYERRYRIGKRHVEVGLEPRYVIAAMAFCRGFAAQQIVDAEYAGDPLREARIIALNRIMDLDLNIMLQSYDDERINQFLEVTGFSKQLFDTLMSGE